MWPFFSDALSLHIHNKKTFQGPKMRLGLFEFSGVFFTFMMSIIRLPPAGIRNYPWKGLYMDPTTDLSNGRAWASKCIRMALYQQERRHQASGLPLPTLHIVLVVIMYYTTVASTVTHWYIFNISLHSFLSSLSHHNQVLIYLNKL